VQNVLQLEQKAKATETHSLIHRAYQQQKNNYEEEEEDEEDDEAMTQENMAQLLELLSLMEVSDNDHQSDNHSEQELTCLLAKFPKLKAAFEASLEKGEIQELVLKPWNPWWRRNLLVNNQIQTKEQTRSNNDNKQQEYAGQHKTLDERLIQVPSLETVSGGKLKTVPNLTFNLLELLYRMAWILRIYHGVENATADGETATDAAMALLQTSTVLSQDARYETLEETMLAVTTSAHSVSSNAVSWTVLAEDVAFIADSSRLIGRALLEALDILKAALIHLKKEQKKQLGNERERANDNISEDITELRRKRKKLEFFLAWSQQPKATIPSSLSEDIRTWVADWRSPNEDKEERELDRLILPSLNSTSAAVAAAVASQSVDPPLLQEVQTKSTKSTPAESSPQIQILE
jgi:hypothetical protein